MKMSEGYMDKVSNICGLCNENPSKYCCPRCEIFYCSLNCYKSQKHMNCSESFYRDCVNQELVSHHVDDESRGKMLDILKRLHNQDVEDPQQIEDLLEDIDNNNTDDVEDHTDDIDSDDAECDDLQDRLKSINLDDADAVWNALTEDEKNEFEALLNQGEVSSIMPQWEPWWTSSKKLIEDANEKEAVLTKCPSLIDVPKLCSLTKVQPSPMIRFNIANVIASYVFIARYFNGDLEPVESTVYLFNICSNLDTSTNFEDLAIAVESVAQKCIQSELIQTDVVSLDVMKQDTFLILRGPSDRNKIYYCKAALSHLHKLLHEAKSLAKTSKTYKQNTKDNNDTFSKKFPEHTQQHFPDVDVSKVKKSVKKIEYYLSFIESYGMEFE